MSRKGGPPLVPRNRCKTCGCEHGYGCTSCGCMCAKTDKEK